MHLREADGLLRLLHGGLLLLWLGGVGTAGNGVGHLLGGGLLVVGDGVTMRYVSQSSRWDRCWGQTYRLTLSVAPVTLSPICSPMPFWLSGFTLS